MAELTTTVTCCAPEAQARCCEPSERADCCGYGARCSCQAGRDGERARLLLLVHGERGQNHVESD
jgi:hypothetical protein